MRFLKKLNVMTELLAVCLISARSFQKAQLRPYEPFLNAYDDIHILKHVVLLYPCSKSGGGLLLHNSGLVLFLIVLHL